MIFFMWRNSIPLAMSFMTFTFKDHDPASFIESCEGTSGCKISNKLPLDIYSVTMHIALGSLVIPKVLNVSRRVLVITNEL